MKFQSHLGYIKKGKSHRLDITSIGALRKNFENNFMKRYTMQQPLRRLEGHPDETDIANGE